MNLLYVAGACLVLAQVVGIYALVTRKADLVFAVVMTVLLVSAVVLGAADLYHKFH